MNTLNTDYDDVLRRALRAAAESVEPSPDGLERIRSRLTTPTLLSFASVTAWYSDFARRAGTWAQPAIGSVLDFFWSVVDRFRPEGARPGHAGPRFGWLRPVAAMGTAIFVVAAGAFAIMTLPQAISSSGQFSLPWNQSTGSAGHGGGSTVQGRGSQMPTGVHSPGPSGGQPTTPPAASKCSALGSSKSSSPTPTPTVSQSTTPTTPASSPPATTPPTSPDPSPDPTPSSSDSSAPDPGSTGTPSPSTSSAAASTTAVEAADAAAKAVTGTAGFDRKKVATALAMSRLQAVHMLPSNSTSPGLSPCPSSSPKKNSKNNRNGPRTLSGGGLAAPGVSEHGAISRALAPGESAKTS